VALSSSISENPPIADIKNPGPTKMQPTIFAAQLYFVFSGVIVAVHFISAPWSLCIVVTKVYPLIFGNKIKPNTIDKIADRIAF
jgi:hypothetical protein